jgi:hypothetical protein
MSVHKTNAIRLIFNTLKTGEFYKIKLHLCRGFGVQIENSKSKLNKKVDLTKYFFIVKDYESSSSESKYPINCRRLIKKYLKLHSNIY